MLMNSRNTRAHILQRFSHTKPTTLTEVLGRQTQTYQTDWLRQKKTQALRILNRLLKALTCKPMQQNEAELSVLPLPNQLLTETMPTY